MLTPARGQDMRAAATAVAAALYLWTCVAPADADDLVTFDSLASRRLQTPFSRAHGEIAPVIPATPLQGFLSKPSGDGPFPAVVLLHPCTGLPATRVALAETIAGWGYVTLFVDDFTTRGLTHSCVNSAFNETVQDALGGLLHVAKLPYVDVRRIALVGFAQGATTALRIAMDRLPPLVDDLKPPVPRAVAAVSPWCLDTRGRLAVPMLVLTGERDDWAPAAYCDELKKRTANNVELRLIVYPDAHHAFNDETMAAGRNVFGHWLQYDADAAARAMSELRAFLAKQLN